MDSIGIAQINLQHSKVASSNLRRLLTVMHSKIFLIQEPYFFRGVQGLDLEWGHVHVEGGGIRSRACIYTRKDVNAMKLQQFCTPDMVTVQVRVMKDRRTFKFICCSLYLPYDAPVQSAALTELLEYCRKFRISFLIGCDANAHNVIWGSSNTNERGIDLMELISVNNLFILNRGNRPTFCNSVREEVIDLTLCSDDLATDISNWEVWQEESHSDHRYIRFDIGGVQERPIFRRNVRQTDWCAFREKLTVSLETWDIPSMDVQGLETAAQSLSGNIRRAFEDSCPLKLVNFGPKSVTWNGRLEHLRRVSRRAWNRRRNYPEAYLVARRKYKAALKEVEVKTFRTLCSDVSSEGELSRLNKIFSKSGEFQAGSLRKPCGDYANDETEVLDLLMSKHFPGCFMRSEVTPVPVLRHSNFSRAEFDMACNMFSKDSITWAINSFKPFKSPGPDTIQPVMLQEGVNLLVSPMKMLFSLSLALGHVPEAWRAVRVTFIPKPGKASYEDAKSFRPISLASFIVKTMERVLDNYIRTVCLSNSPIQRTQHAYMKGKSTITAVHTLSSTIEGTFEQKQFCLAAFLDVEGAFDNTSYLVIGAALRNHSVSPVIVEWVIGMLKNRVLSADLRGVTENRIPARGCPQGGVLSPLLWILVADSLLKRLSDLGFESIGYADDFVILSKGRFATTVYDRMQVALKAVEEWCCKTELSVNPSKTVLVLFTKNRNLQGVRDLVLFDSNLSTSSEVKYLGLVFDSKLNWNQHLSNRIQKACRIYGQCRKFFGLSWGLKPKYIYWMYSMLIVPYLMYGCAVWWQRGEVGVFRSQLNHLQRMCCLGVTGALTTTPTAALEAILNILPLHILAEKIARATSYKLAVTGEWHTRYNCGHSTVWMRQTQEEPLLLAPCDYIPRVTVLDRKFSVIIPSREECETIIHSFEENDNFIFYTDGSVTNSGSGAGIFCERLQLNSFFSLGNYTTILQAEIFAITVCIQKCIELLLVGKPICICSDSQAALRALQSYSVTSVSILECIKLLNRMSAVELVTLLWIPAHSGFRGNAIADNLAKQGSSSAFTGPEPCLALPVSWFKIRNDQWAKKQHLDYWTTLPTCRDTKLYIQEPSDNIADYLFNLSKSHLRILVRGLTGHCRFNHHMFKLGISNECICPMCGSDFDTPYHLLCLCPRFAMDRHELFGDYVLNANEYRSLNIKEILNFFLNSGRDF